MVADFAGHGADGVNEIGDWCVEGVCGFRVWGCVWSSVWMCSAIVVGPGEEWIGVFLVGLAEALKAVMRINDVLLDGAVEFGGGFWEVSVQIGVGKSPVEVEAGTVGACFITSCVHVVKVFSGWVVHIVALVELSGM